MNKYRYAITSKKTRQPITKQHYLDYLDALSDDGRVCNVNFETTRGLHVHFVLETTKPLRQSQLYKTQYGWNHKSVPIYNEKGWRKYCRKDHEDNIELNAQLPYDEDLIDDPDCCMPVLKRNIMRHAYKNI